MNPETLPGQSVPPGACVPFAEKAREWPPIQGDAELVERVWEDLDGMAYTYIWQCLLSF
jgi:hypothetical protein